MKTPDNVDEFLRMTEPRRKELRKKLRCIYCDKKIKGAYMATTAGPLHKRCVDEWEQHSGNAMHG